MSRRIPLVALALASALLLLPPAASAEPAAAAWTEMSIGGLYGWYGLSFADESSGWACGTNGMVARTTNGGDSWSILIPDGDSRIYEDIDAVSASCAWASGQGYFDGKWSTAIVHTEDGGQTWATCTVPGTFSPIDLDFVDEAHGWVCADGSLFRTDDAGSTWTKEQLPAPVQAVEAVDGSHAWAITGDAGWRAGTSLYGTDDGGGTWEWLTDKPLLAIQQMDSFMDVSFVDTDHGFVVGPRGLGATSDGGATWAWRSYPGDGNPSLCAADSRHAWVTAGYLSSGGVWATDDAGATWFRQAYGGGNVIAIHGEKGWVVGSGALHTSRSGFSDMRPPVTHCDPPGWISTATTIALSAIDEGTGVAETWYRIDPALPWTAGNAALFEAPGGLNGETRSLVVSSRDMYGNWEPEHAYTVHIDTVGPSPHFSPLNAYDLDYWINKPSEVIVTGEDANGCGVDDLEVSRDGGDWVRLPNHSTVVTPAPADHSNDGVHSLSLRATDVLGNVGAEQTRETYIDTRRPVSRAPYSAAMRYHGYVTVKFRVNDKDPCARLCLVKITIKTLRGKTMGYVRPGKWFATGLLKSTRFHCPLKRGKYRFYVTAWDGATNKTSVPASNLLTIR